MITANRYRHATDEERRLGQGPMVAHWVTYDLSKSEALTDLRRALVNGTPGVRAEDVIALDADRPVRETALRAVYPEAVLQKSFTDAEDDPVADEQDLRKSEEAESGADLKRLVLIRDEIVVKSEPGPHWGAPSRRVEEEFYLPAGDMGEVRDTLLAALADGHPVVRADDVSLLERGGIREVVLKALFQDGEFVESDSLMKAELDYESEGLPPDAVSVVETAYRSYREGQAPRNLRRSNPSDLLKSAAAELEAIVARSNAGRSR